MYRTLFTTLLGLCISTAALAQPPLRELDDTELAQVRGRDGVSFAMHLVMNDPTVPVVRDSRLTWGMKDAGGQTSYVVIKNLGGVIDMAAISLGVHKNPGGGDYMAVSLPGYVKFTNFGFESLSVQNDALAPVTGNLGSINMNGNLSLQGQVRFWAH